MISSKNVSNQSGQNRIGNLLNGLGIKNKSIY